MSWCWSKMICSVITFAHKYSDRIIKVFRPEFCVAAVIMFLLLLVFDHLCCWEKPKEQKTIILIILTPTVHVIASYIGLKLPNRTHTVILVLESIKDCYAALVFPMVLSLLYGYLHINDGTLSRRDIRLIIQRRLITNYFPVTLHQPQLVLITLNNLKLFELWAWQFVGIRIFCAILMIVLQLLDIYSVWLSWAFFLILNVSAFFACYAVTVFYIAFSDDYKLHVHEKFFFFRGIVFVCFFQKAVLRILVASGIIKSNEQDLQNNLVLWEMLFLSFTTKSAFTDAIYDAPAPILPIVKPVRD